MASSSVCFFISVHRAPWYHKSLLIDFLGCSTLWWKSLCRLPFCRARKCQVHPPPSRGLITKTQAITATVGSCPLTVNPLKPLFSRLSLSLTLYLCQKPAMNLLYVTSEVVGLIIMIQNCSGQITGSYMPYTPNVINL